MARMIPSDQDDFNESYGEGLVYNALRDCLPGEYTVFHSFKWNRRTPFNRMEWGEADFTVFHPKYGLIIIEVKSGSIILENSRWFYKRSGMNDLTPMKDPMDQANKTKFYFIDLLAEILPPGQMCWVDSAVWFPSLSDRSVLQSMPKTYHPETVLMEWALMNTEQAIKNAYKFYNSRSLTSLSQQSVKTILDTLAPEFRAVQSLSAASSEQEYAFFRLTNEQNGLIDYLDEQPMAVIQGSAGTGKTMLAVEKAKRLSENGTVLFLCFNRFLVEELREKNEGYTDSITFSNLPSLVKTKTMHFSVPDDGEITEYLYDAFDSWSYKHIIIDEGQDFHNDHLEILFSIARAINGSIYVFYDEKQLIQRQNTQQCLQNADCRLVLRRNCRNTRKIALTSVRSIGGEPILWEKAPEGKTPEMLFLPNQDALVRVLSQIIDKYFDGGIPLTQITILTVKTEEKSCLAEVTRFGKHRVTRTRNQTDILFTTVRKFKGLESTAVILVDVDSGVFSTLEARNLLYVGASRAKNFLDILSIVDEQELNTMAEVITGRKVSGSARFRQIAKFLEVRLRSV